jgi:hypothetical protein
MGAAEAYKTLEELKKIENGSNPEQINSRRQHRRFAIRAQARLEPIGSVFGSKDILEVSLRDISRGGISVICASPIQADTLWNASFLRSGRPFAEQTIFVRHCRQIGADCYLTGAQFVASSALLVQLGVGEEDLDYDERRQTQALSLTESEDAFESPDSIE